MNFPFWVIVQYANRFEQPDRADRI